MSPLNLVWSTTDVYTYWKHISSMVDAAGEKKYEHLSFVAKAALTLSHRKAAPERDYQ